MNRPLATLPESARKALAEIGPIWGTDIQKHRDITLATYLPLLAQGPKAGVEKVNNLAYGRHPRQVLDLFRPAGKSKMPVVIFLHGGAFLRGDKCVNAEVYDNVLYWFARHGVLGINLEYRLAPESTYPGTTDDVAQAVAWVQAHAAGFGGDPENMFLIGHSAGGTHAAAYAWDPASGYLGRHLKGLVLISARLRADVAPENPNAGGVRAYWGEDASLYEARSPVTHAAASHLPVMIANAEFENPLLDIYGLEAAWRIAQARCHAPRYVRLTGHNHISIVAHFNTEEEILGREILDFFETLT
ncbi:MAG TPA: alpha/beta hydrolase [Burkholderiales bacterium]